MRARLRFLVFAAAALAGAADADIVDNGLVRTGPDGLAELMSKVATRADATTVSLDERIVRVTTDSDGTYFLTEAGHPAHRFAMYCGLQDSGSIEVRAWTSADDPAVAEALRQSLLARVRAAESCETGP